MLNRLSLIALCPWKVLVENGWLKIGTLGRGLHVLASDARSPLEALPSLLVPYAAPELIEQGASCDEKK